MVSATVKKPSYPKFIGFETAFPNGPTFVALLNLHFAILCKESLAHVSMVKGEECTFNIMTKSITMLARIKHTVARVMEQLCVFIRFSNGW